MKQLHPFLWISSDARGRVFLVWTAAALLLTYLMQVVGTPLVNDTAPQGIVSFELAGTQEAAESILASWSHTARTYAGLSLGLDYLFMVAYGGAISLGCVVVAQRLDGFAAALGGILSWGTLLAVLLDVVENLALIQVLFGAAGVWPLVARWCAIPKFALVGTGLLYVLLGAVWRLAHRR